MSNDEHLIVGVGRIVLAIHGIDSLKGKRGILNRIKARVQNRFNVSISEVGYQDLHSRAVLGVAVVSSDLGYVQRLLEKIVRFVENLGEAEVLLDEVDIVNYGGGFSIG